ncbi:hypothetical protein B0H19DRAFT_1170336 [Mycena capillaripes]|nr:hypothetical protein B0H19DRAFT_1170336 [Mycena capillaripes]
MSIRVASQAARGVRRLGGTSGSLKKQLFTKASASIARATREIWQWDRRVRSPEFLTYYVDKRSPYSTLAQEQKAPGSEIDEDRALLFLEGFSNHIRAFTPAEEVTCLRVSYTIIYEIMRYLARHGDDSEAYLSVFMNSEAPPNSNIDRARKSVFRLTKFLVSSLLSPIPQSSSLRVAHSATFDLLGALEPSFMIYGGEGDVKEWTKFWARTQPILLELATQLDQAGFGAD